MGVVDNTLKKETAFFDDPPKSIYSVEDHMPGGIDLNPICPVVPPGPGATHRNSDENLAIACENSANRGK